MENVKKFYDALMTDEQLRTRGEAVLESYTTDSPPDDKEAAAMVADFAKSEGFEFTPEDFIAYMQESRELSDEELENVAGGGCRNTAACMCMLGGGGTLRSRTCACVLNGLGIFGPRHELQCIAGGTVNCGPGSKVNSYHGRIFPWSWDWDA